ncbi:MAG: exported protein of unknown function [Armatimonadetes bacterium]|jgi:hypothetical protein|nr:exported protein of unknown function [Armatimonadota bacterium]
MPYLLNNQSMSLDEEPVVRDGRNFVPLESVVQSLGGTVVWDDSTKTARATITQWTANVQMDNPVVDVSGTKVTLQDAPYVEDGKMWVPWYFFRDAYGYKVEMNDGTLNVHL